MVFAHLSGGPCGSSADNPANVQGVVVGSCERVLKATFEIERQLLRGRVTVDPSGAFL